MNVACDSWMLWCTGTKTIFREIPEVKDNNLRELIDSENTGKHDHFIITVPWRNGKL